MTFNADDLDRELRQALKGPSYYERFISVVRSIAEPLGFYLSIPPYQPNNQDWEITFRALGLDYKQVNKFWRIFYKINKSGDGEVSLIEFMNFFDLDRTVYVEKAFNYCDTVGGGEMDFLEFVVSIVNFCSLNQETLCNFTFDLYDLDNDGEIAYDEIETLVRELYGPSWDQSSLARDALNDMALLSEKHGGGIPLDAFIQFHRQHGLLLFPCFVIQRNVQRKVMGLDFWDDYTNAPKSRKVEHGEKRFDPRHVQSVLRTYKTGSAAAILTHTGDPNEGLREWIKKGKETPVVDYDKVKEEIEKKRGAKLSLIAEWRRRVNPKQREEYRRHLIQEAREIRAQEQRLAKEAAELQRIADEKAEAALQRAKNDVLDMLKGGVELDTEQQAFALEHGLYEVLILGQNAAELLKEQEKVEEEKKQREIEALREKMIMERVKGGGPEEEEEEEEFKYDPNEGAAVEVEASVVEKRVMQMGSNGRPKVHRKGRRMAEEGRWVDRPPPSKEPPQDVKKVGKPEQIFDRKGKPLKQKRKKSKSGRSSKRTSRATSRSTSRAQSPVGGLPGPAATPGDGGREEKKMLTPADKMLAAQSDSRKASRRASRSNSRRPSITWERRASKGNLELPPEVMMKGGQGEGQSEAKQERKSFNNVKLAPIMATPKHLMVEEHKVREQEQEEEDKV